MALIERTVTDKVEILAQTGHIQIRKANQIVREETGEVVSQKFWRGVVTPGDKDRLVEVLTNDPDDPDSVAGAQASADLLEQGAWFPEILAAWEAQQAEQDPTEA